MDGQAPAPPERRFSTGIRVQLHMQKTRLKGGSLSGTYLCRTDAGVPFVRKEASLNQHREYGFQRWYSQLKKLQRYAHLFPEAFPKVLDYGRAGDLAYFDIEYVPDSITAHEFLCGTTSPPDIDRMFGKLKDVMASLHRARFPSTPNAADLYIFEEVEQKMFACKDNARFKKLIAAESVSFNGHSVPGLHGTLGDFKRMFKEAYHNPTETFTHGNLTLENILYCPAANKITLIDPYEENIIDSELAEYSQLLQSSNSHYELFNASAVTVDGSTAACRVTIPPGLDYFNGRFLEHLQATLAPNDVKVVRLLEVSQYARMLPFKMEIDADKMVFFYALGSYLFHRLKEDWSR
jgi:hypothetical protein